LETTTLDRSITAKLKLLNSALMWLDWDILLIDAGRKEDAVSEVFRSVSMQRKKSFS